jgi:hypothetical protein
MPRRGAVIGDEDTSNKDEIMEEVAPPTRKNPPLKSVDKGKAATSSSARAPRRKVTFGKKKGKAYDSEGDTNSPPPDAEIITGLELRAPIIDGTYAPPYAALTKGKGKMDKIRTLRHEDPLMYEKEEEIHDDRFHNLLHVDFYRNALRRKPDFRVIPQMYIDWEGCSKLKDKSLNRALDILEKKGLRDIM